MLTKPGRNDPCPCGSRKKYKKCCRDKFSSSSPLINAKYQNKHQFQVKGKAAEDFVHEIARKTFFEDWCYLRPKLSDGKELCDLLVVFDDIVIIWQVKSLKVEEDEEYKKSETEKNLRQLSGAKRKLFDLKTPVNLKNERRGEEIFDPSKIKEVYLISVVLSENPPSFINFFTAIKDKAVHVFGYNFIETVLKELDTISDFVNYLRAKEKFFKTAGQRMTLISGGEEELLALYLLGGRSFKKYETFTFLNIEEGHWKKVIESEPFKNKEKEDEISMLWDDLIERAHQNDDKKYEIVARELARPNRVDRRVLSKAYYEAQKIAGERIEEYFSRMFLLNGTTYCFLFMNDEKPAKRRMFLLESYCKVLRVKFQNNKKVIGIGADKIYLPNGTYEFGLFESDSVSEEFKKEVEELRGEMGLFTKEKYNLFYDSEYPKKNEPWRMNLLRLLARGFNFLGIKNVKIFDILSKWAL